MYEFDIMELNIHANMPQKSRGDDQASLHTGCAFYSIYCTTGLRLLSHTVMAVNFFYGWYMYIQQIVLPLNIHFFYWFIQLMGVLGPKQEWITYRKAASIIVTEPGRTWGILRTISWSLTGLPMYCWKGSQHELVLNSEWTYWCRVHLTGLLIPYSQTKIACSRPILIWLPKQNRNTNFHQYRQPLTTAGCKDFE